MDTSKKMAAAITAVLQYIQTEEEAVCMQLQAPAAPGPSVPAAAPFPAPSLWAASGRQTQMQLRNLMQLKSFHGTGIR